MSREEFTYFYNYADILNNAKIGKPLIIVEGEYDYIYEYLSDNIEKDCEITPIGNLIGKEGNLAIEKLMLDIENFAKEENLEYIPHILGLIDRDFREYEDNLIESPILFILDFYSIESYFVNNEILYKILDSSIRSKRLINNVPVSSLYNKIKETLINDLYLQSINKLKIHLEINEVVDKFELLKSFETLLKITKGKDLLTRFLVEIQNILSKDILYKYCRDGKISPCKRYYEDKHQNFCLYKTQKYNIPQLRKYSFEQVDIKSLIPIKNRIQQLK